MEGARWEEGAKTYSCRHIYPRPGAETQTAAVMMKTGWQGKMKEKRH